MKKKSPSPYPVNSSYTSYGVILKAEKKNTCKMIAQSFYLPYPSCIKLKKYTFNTYIKTMFYRQIPFFIYSQIYTFLTKCPLKLTFYVISATPIMPVISNSWTDTRDATVKVLQLWHLDFTSKIMMKLIILPLPIMLVVNFRTVTTVVM